MSYIQKYEGASELAGFRSIVKKNAKALCSERDTSVDPTYRGDFTNFRVGFVSYKGGEVKGFVVGLDKSGKGYIELLCGEGHGTRLMNSITEWYKNNGYKSMTLLPVSHGLVNYYEGHGFTCTKRDRNGDVTCMEKKIKPYSSSSNNLASSMSNLNIKSTSTSTSSRLPNGCAKLREYSKYVNDLESYAASDLKGFVKDCSLASGSAPTKSKAIEIIKSTIRQYKSQYNL